MLWYYGSSAAIPFFTLVALLALWFGVSVPLTFVGAYFGFRKPMIEQPVRTNQIPRQIPDQSIDTQVTNQIPDQSIYTQVTNQIPDQSINTQVTNQAIRSQTRASFFTQVTYQIPDQSIYTQVR